MKLIKKVDKGFSFWLCVNDVFSRYACVASLKDKKGVTIVNAFEMILNK